MEKHLQILHAIKDSDISMAFLPMSHILEKAWCYFCITRGLTIAVNYDPRIIADTIHTVHPNLMCCVPRFWEKVYAGVREKIEAMPRIQKMMIRRSLRVGKARNLKYLRTGRNVPWLLEREYRFWDRRVFSKLKHAVGIPDELLPDRRSTAIRHHLRVLPLDRYRHHNRLRSVGNHGHCLILPAHRL